MTVPLKDLRMSIRLTAEEFALATQPERKLSRVPPGHWRCVFEWIRPDEVDEAKAIVAGCDILAPGIIRTPERFLTREIAETIAAEWIAEAEAYRCCRIIRHFRAEFFPGERP